MSGAEDQVRKLCDDLKALAMIGAAFKIQAASNGDAAEPAIRARIMSGAQASLQQDPKAIDEQRSGSIAQMIGMALAEAQELFNNPFRAGEWKVEDAVLMQRQGQASSFAFRQILSLANDRPLLAKALEGRFLDVGTGVGGIALEAARSCPKLHVDGIDVWDPALALAAQNLNSSGLSDRVTFEKRDVRELEGAKRYTLVWLPTMFLKRLVLIQAIERIVATSLENSYIVAAVYSRPEDKVLADFAALRTLRSGGEVTEPLEVEKILRDGGYEDVESFPGPLATFIVGRRSSK